MKRFSLTSQKVCLRLQYPWQVARTARSSIGENITLELRSPEGLIGLGEAAPIARYGESTDAVESILSQLDIQRLATEWFSGNWSAINAIPETGMSARAAVDMALMDLLGKKQGKPVHDLIGLPFHDKQYRTSFTIGIDEPNVIRTKLIAAERFPVLKIKVGGPRDREVLRLVHDVAPNKTLWADANEAWRTKEQALKLIEWLAAESPVELVEQPMPASTPPADWKWLKDHSPIPIFADESYHTAADASRAADCFHGVNVKLAKAGGIRATHEALQAARKAGLKTMLGCMIETSLSISAAAHLAEVSDYLDLDGNLLISNDPFHGVVCEDSQLSFGSAREKYGLRVQALRTSVAHPRASHAELA